MNIKITHNWLLEYLDTEATSDEIKQYLSLCGPSVERVEKIGDDYLYEIEVTSNRVDAASVLGIAQEAAAILPMFGKKAKLKFNPLEKYQFSRHRFCSDGDKNRNNLRVEIKNDNLCSRFTAIVLDNIKIKPAPDFMRLRLNACGIKSLNNVIDISNYLMLAFGQPTHIFDYDLVRKQTMIMRESRPKEKIVTLDGKEIILPGGDIVIEDGDKRLIDLCGIMGGLNSAVSFKTKRVILFVQTYNKEKIRKTSMTTGQRTLAATYFEKGLDEERVEPTLIYGIKLLEKYAEGRTASIVYDLYPKPYKNKLLVVSYKLLDKTIGVKIERERINTILKNLGFRLYQQDQDRHNLLKVAIPSYRKNDINFAEDIVEEVARIYGYHRLPGRLPPPAIVNQPKEIEKIFHLEQKIKYFLKHLGLNEVMNYSMISKEMIQSFNLNPKKHLRLKNTLSEEIEYMRTTLLPSLIKNIKENRGKRDVLKLFEIAKVYLPRKNDLPAEIYKLAIAVNTDFFDLKGIIEALYKELNIDKEVSEKIIFKDGVFLVEIDLKNLITQSRTIPCYQPINPYAVIKLDLTVEVPKKLNFATIKKSSLSVSKLLQKIEFVDIFKNKVTLRFYFSSNKRNITEEEAKAELTKIKNKLSLY